jgi:PhnB protein
MSGMTITPHIVVSDAAAASEWYQRALGAVETDRLPLPGGKNMYVELRFGDDRVMAADEFPDFGILSPLDLGGTAVVLHLECEDVDAAWKTAVDAGAEVLSPLQDQFWGARQGQLRDPFGHKWNLAHQVREVPRAELEAAAASVFAST